MHSLSRKAEDYLEAILNASFEKGYARTKDIAQELCIQPPTVVEMVKKLDRMGMITYRKYEGVTLTLQGKKIAEVIRDRHETLQSFLELMKVPHAIAVKDACMMEHELSTETIEQLRMFLAFLKVNPQVGSVMKNFEAFSIRVADRHQDDARGSGQSSFQS
ncbi:metal-dependent transcriptional regulator [Methanosphaerula palustris]|uniref:Iron (Metal) dependent repressor, DtxR family n=1 Tax=Methanosphaerula palustris (strain ATCC BAA-1556 / DSM 19958 / E1-9c) TaxID=521011 RepID=B8GEB2_METPE|nr:metal-dependent transcriptional regulator [Methanosphaerula palustris]ACL17613.1 iron (metal) dependent repressor, DtxR family [Methanosphaerula palustris E1-9c]